MSNFTQEELERIFAEAAGISANTETSTPVTEEQRENVAQVEEIVQETEEAPQNNAVPLERLGTTYTNENLQRFSSAEWAEYVKTVTMTIGGAGGISSWLAFLLARLDVGGIRIYDDDIVESSNLGGQLFARSDIKLPKVNAVRKHIGLFSNFYKVECISRKIAFGSRLVTPVVFCGFDNMEARKLTYVLWKNNANHMFKPEDMLFIDGRLAAEALQVYCVCGDDGNAMKKYEEECLFDDTEADATVCSYKQTSFMAAMIASVMTNMFVNWCTTRAGGFRPLPFFTEYDAVTTNYKIEMI